MGLLEQFGGLLEQFNAYKAANTPRSTRPAVSPAKVFNEGLLNPNQYNAPAANRFKDSAFGALGIVPGVGDAAAGAEAADLWNRGDKFAGSLAALGALPLIPAIGGMFVGKGAKTWDVLKAQQAEGLLAKGVDPRDVWKQTGTAKFADGMLRQEIPDNAAAMDSGGRFFGTKGGGGKASQVLEHDELYRAYPEVGDINTSYYFETAKHGGSFNESSNFIQVDAPMGYQSSKDTTLHEIQHAIQQREGWAKGGNPEAMAHEAKSAKARFDDLSAASIMQRELASGKRAPDIFRDYEEIGMPLPDKALMMASEYQPKELESMVRSAEKQFTEMGGFAGASDNTLYRRLAGEAEARLTQSRMGLDAAQRLEHYPYDMGQYGLDVPMDRLIVRGLLGGN
jgi:hypothetical protein